MSVKREREYLCLKRARSKASSTLVLTCHLFTAKQLVEEERDDSEHARSTRIDLDHCIFFVRHRLYHVARHEEVKQDSPEHDTDNNNYDDAKRAIVLSLEISADLVTLTSQVPDIVDKQSKAKEGKREGDTEGPALPIFDILRRISDAELLSWHSSLLKRDLRAIWVR